MLFLIFISSLFLSVSCQIGYKYIELQKFGEINVGYNTRVYFNISSYIIGEHISFEIIMDLSNANYWFQRENYYFYIAQVSTIYYDDNNYWSNLPIVNNGNKSCDKNYLCIFKWEEIIGKVGNNYIFIELIAPYSGFFFLDEKQIKIKNVNINNKNNEKSISISSIVTIIFCFMLFLSLIILVIICYICNKNGNNSKYFQFEKPEYTNFGGLTPAPVCQQSSEGVTVY